jgi:hypothetical protein
MWFDSAVIVVGVIDGAIAAVTGFGIGSLLTPVSQDLTAAWGLRPFCGWVLRRNALLSLSCALLATGCAFNRSHVKSLRDNAATSVQFDAVIRTTVAALNAIPAHCGPTRDHRVRDEECRVYEVVGRIVRVKREPDHDIHIVLEDPDDPRQRLVVESDDPEWRGNRTSPYHDQLAAARRMFDALVAEAPDHRVQGLTVRVTGVGFFDMTHFQIGRSRSCIELHPILSIESCQGRPPDAWVQHACSTVPGFQ